MCSHGSSGGSSSTCATCSEHKWVPRPTARLYHERSPVACIHAAGQIAAGDRLVLFAELWVALCGAGGSSTAARVNLTVKANIECGRLSNLHVTGEEMSGGKIAEDRLAFFLEYRAPQQAPPV